MYFFFHNKNTDEMYRVKNTANKTKSKEDYEGIARNDHAEILY
jgi:hypothetical protein